MLLGFSTGCLYKTHNRLAPATFDIFRQAGCNAIELMWHDFGQTQDFLKLQSSDLAGFEYVSVHAPIFAEQTPEEVVEILRILELKHQELHFDLVVMHPDGIMNWNLFRSHDIPFAIENMDNRKTTCRNLEDLQKIFEQTDFRMVLDVNHCYSNDPSMQLAKNMAVAFSERICEVHLSGFAGYHEPIYQTQQLEILQAIPNKQLPIILESGIAHVEEVEKEFKYVRNFLN